MSRVIKRTETCKSGRSKRIAPARWGKEVGGREVGEVCRLSSFPQVFVRFGSADVLLCRCLLQESFLLFHLWPPQHSSTPSNIIPISAHLPMAVLPLYLCLCVSFPSIEGFEACSSTPTSSLPISDISLECYYLNSPHIHLWLLHKPTI